MSAISMRLRYKFSNLFYKEQKVNRGISPRFTFYSNSIAVKNSGQWKQGCGSAIGCHDRK